MTTPLLPRFLITWLLPKEDDRNDGISLTAFYARRTVRIFPAFHCYWLIVAILGLAFSAPVVWPQAWSAFLT